LNKASEEEEAALLDKGEELCFLILKREQREGRREAKSGKESK
jgi:hypothetical protein